MSDPTRLRTAQRLLLQASVAGTGADLCGPCLQVLPVDGAAVSLLTGTARHETLCASDPVAERLDELQFDLGEGPCWQAMDTGRAVLVPDVQGVEHQAWPLFGAAARRTPVAAIFAFPVRMGGMDLGALDLYNTAPGPMSPDTVRAATTLADTMGWVMMRHLLRDGADDPAGEARFEREMGRARREVHQAVGMVLAQVGTNPDGAFCLLRARAFAEDRPVMAVARDVLARRITFS